MQDAWRAYLELALGVTEASKKKAQKVAQRLVGKGGTTAAQLQALTEDLLSAGTANREALTKMVRGEVERTLSRVGLASAEEVTALSDRVRELEAELRDARARASAAEASARTGGPNGPASDDALETLSAGAGPAPAGSGTAGAGAGTAGSGAGTAGSCAKTPAKKAVAKKAVAKKAVAKRTPAEVAPAPTEPAPTAPAASQPATKVAGKAAGKAVAKKAVAKKAVAKKAAGKTAVAKKTAARKSGREDAPGAPSAGGA